MARLRDPERGCEWDLAQDFASIAPYTIEEAYEVADAIERRAFAELKDELGDLLLQVVFHARMAEEAGLFDFEDVAQAISNKMERRHPHIFGEDAEGGAMTDARWETLKALEREGAGATSAMDGVARALPALQRAQKLQKRAARDGFEWDDARGRIDKLIEELEELDTAADEAEREMEAGDVLFVVVNLLNHYGIDAETALRRSGDKFERRYRAMEALAEGAFAALPLERQEALWQRVKSGEREDGQSVSN